MGFFKKKEEPQVVILTGYEPAYNKLMAQINTMSPLDPEYDKVLGRLKEVVSLMAQKMPKEKLKDKISKDVLFIGGLNAAMFTAMLLSDVTGHATGVKPIWKQSFSKLPFNIGRKDK